MTAPEHKPDIGCLKVSSKSSPASVAGAIAGMVKDGVGVEIQAVGAGAVNQAVKAIAISRGFLSPWASRSPACPPLRTSLSTASTARPFASQSNRATRAASPCPLPAGEAEAAPSAPAH